MIRLSTDAAEGPSGVMIVQEARDGKIDGQGSPWILNREDPNALGIAFAYFLGVDEDRFVSFDEVVVALSKATCVVVSTHCVGQLRIRREYDPKIAEVSCFVMCHSIAAEVPFWTHGLEGEGAVVGRVSILRFHAFALYCGTGQEEQISRIK